MEQKGLSNKLNKLNHSHINSVLFFSCIIIPHMVLGWLWPYIERSLGLQNLIKFFPMFIQLGVIFMQITVYCSFYHFEFDFLKKYRVTDLKWPWEEKPEEWSTHRFRLGWVYFRNMVIIASIVNKFVFATTNPRYDTASFPSLLLN